MANAAAAQIRAAAVPCKLYVSVQVEVAWGRPSGPYQGIAQDLTDFPFMDALGLSSYPYLGGFAVGSFVSSPALQARYLTRQLLLLDHAAARGVFQLTFYDLDLSGFSPPPPPNIGLFTHLGLADSAMNAKPALTVWDNAFRRPYSP